MAVATTHRPRTLTARGYQRSVDAFGVGAGDQVRAASVLDKVAGLTLLAIGAGAVGYASDSPGLLIASLVIGAITGMAACWAPRTARYLAAPYALTEGIVLGAISHLYESINGRIVPLAILVTAAIYVATLISYRSGLVRGPTASTPWQTCSSTSTSSTGPNPRGCRRRPSGTWRSWSWSAWCSSTSTCCAS